jgi:hypothetical protein
MRQRDLGTERRFAVACIMPWRAILRGAGAMDESAPPISRALRPFVEVRNAAPIPIFLLTLRIAPATPDQ